MRRFGPRDLYGDQESGKHDRRLGEEDRAPRERLGERTAQGGSDGDPEDGRRHPHPPSGTRPASVEQREGRDEPCRSAERLNAAEHEQQAERVRGAAAERRREEEGKAGGADMGVTEATAQPCRRQQRQRQDGGVDAEDERDALDRRIELDQDRRQPEGDDRGVRQGDPGGERYGDALHGAKLALAVRRPTAPAACRGSPSSPRRFRRRSGRGGRRDRRARRRTRACSRSRRGSGSPRRRRRTSPAG